MVTDLIRDIGDPQAGVPHIGLGEFDPPAVDILRKAVAGDLPEPFAEIVVAHGDIGGGFVHGEIPADFFIDKRQDGLEL